jgi:hypothetical protein
MAMASARLVNGPTWTWMSESPEHGEWQRSSRASASAPHQHVGVRRVGDGGNLHHDSLTEEQTMTLRVLELKKRLTASTAEWLIEQAIAASMRPRRDRFRFRGTGPA